MQKSNLVGWDCPGCGNKYSTDIKTELKANQCCRVCGESLNNFLPRLEDEEISKYKVRIGILEARIVQLLEALSFYNDPEAWDGIAQEPCMQEGKFMSDTMKLCPPEKRGGLSYNYRYGKVAHEAIINIIPTVLAEDLKTNLEKAFEKQHKFTEADVNNLRAQKLGEMIFYLLDQELATHVNVSFDKDKNASLQYSLCKVASPKKFYMDSTIDSCDSFKGFYEK